MLRVSICSLLVCTTLTGCVGTWITQREVDTSDPYPNLHSVPDKPPKKNFKKIDIELENFETAYEKSMDTNEQIRKENIAPTKPE